MMNDLFIPVIVKYMKKNLDITLFNLVIADKFCQSLGPSPLLTKLT